MKFLQRLLGMIFRRGGKAVFLPTMHGIDGTEYDADVYCAMAADYAYLYGAAVAESDYAAGGIDRTFYQLVMDAAESELETVYGIAC